MPTIRATYVGTKHKGVKRRNAKKSPKGTTRRQVESNLNVEELEIIDAAAELEGVSRAEFMRLAALERAEKSNVKERVIQRQIERQTGNKSMATLAAESLEGL